MITLKATLPDMRQVERALRDWPQKGMRKFIERDAAPLFESTVRTWSAASRPTFRRVLTYFPAPYGAVFADDDRIYRFVSEGTKIRYATMEKGFVPKTRPGRIVAQPGAGGLAYISRRVPRPGIEARKFDVQIARASAPMYKRRMIDALRQAIRESGHGR